MIEITEQEIGKTEMGDAVKLYTLTNSRGEWVKLLNLGATVAGVAVADKDGKIDDVVLGYKDWQSYQGDGAAMGKSVGRYANRIALGKFTLDNKEYNLAINNGPNALHGGPTGFQNRVWSSEIVDNKVAFKYVSEAGEEGYPSQLVAGVEYSWDDDNNLQIIYTATTDGATIVNLTNHLYFNLKGEGNGIIEDHQLTINAKTWLPTDATQIPTGEIAPVASTPMDFTTPQIIGSRIAEDYEPLIIGKGYDHCWVVDNYAEGKLTEVAELYSPESGRLVEVSTTQPGIQIYTGNWLAGSPMGKTNEYIDRSGVAMECQNFPDSPNKVNFPSPIIRKGELYKQEIVYTFKTK